MTRDMELVREILRAIIAKPDLKPEEIRLEGRDPVAVGAHIAMLHKAGYIEGTAFRVIKSTYPAILVENLTWEGHEFAGALLTDETTWEKVKTAFGPEKLAAAPLKIIQDVATAALKAWAMNRIGL